MSTTAPNVLAARACSAPCWLAAAPPTPSAIPIARTPTSAHATPFAIRPIRPSAYSHAGGDCARARVFARCSTKGQRPTAASRCALGVRVLRPGAALGRRQAAALRGDRAALHAVRRCEIDGDGPVAADGSDLVHLRGAHVHPQLRDVARNLALETDVIRLVVSRLIPRQEDGRELVEGELSVRARIRRRAPAA